jgi:hypothetical protein
MIEELRDWVRQLEEARDYWHEHAMKLEAEVAALREAREV